MLLVLIEIKNVEINWEWRHNKKCLNESLHSVEKEHILHTLKDVSGKHPQDLAIHQMAEYGEAQVKNNIELYQWQEGWCNSDGEKNVDT